MVSSIQTCTTYACDVLENLTKSQGFFKREIVSRVASPFVAVPVLADAVANVVVGLGKIPLAIICKIIEIGCAFFGQEIDLGKYGIQAANQLGKAIASPLAAVSAFVGFLYPAVTLSVCRTLGLSAVQTVVPQPVQQPVQQPVVPPAKTKMEMVQEKFAALKLAAAPHAKTLLEKAATHPYIAGAAVGACTLLLDAAVGFGLVQRGYGKVAGLFSK